MFLWDDKKIMSTLQINRGRHKSFLDSSLRLDGIISILEATSGERSYWSQILIKSNIKLKRSFIKYLKFCTDRGFVVSTHGLSSAPGRGENSHVVFYTITEKGRAFLEILS